MYNKMIYMMILLMLGTAYEPTWAMSSKPAAAVKSAANSAVNTANELGNNDAVQQAAGDAGQAVSNYGGKIINEGYGYINNGVDNGRVRNMINNGTNIAVGGKVVEWTGKAAPHVGWVATSAGRASTGDYSGAAIEGVNGAARTITVGKIGTAAGTAGGIWVAGKLGAVAGSWAGPLGAGAGFIIGCGAAYLGGKIWDKTIGKGAHAIDQKVKDWEAERRYAGDPKNRKAAQQNARQAQRTAKPPRPQPSKPGRCTGNCPR